VNCMSLGQSSGDSAMLSQYLSLQRIQIRCATLIAPSLDPFFAVENSVANSMAVKLLNLTVKLVLPTVELLHVCYC